MLKNMGSVPWLIVQLKDQSFAISAGVVREIVALPHCSRIPLLPPHIRGVIKVRDEVMPLVDARMRIGARSVEEETEEFCSILEQREADHRHWLKELDDSVSVGKAFGLTTDPHRCAFGEWYDSYRPENPWIAGHLAKFDRPHKSIHAIASEVLPLQASGQGEKAKGIIERTRNRDLAEMIALFAEMKRLVRESSRETAVVIVSAGRTFAVSVDRALSLETIEDGSVEELPAGSHAARGGLVEKLARRAGDKQPVLILEPDRLL